MFWRISTLVLLICTVDAVAADWPQWLGPNRDGVTAEKIAAWKVAPKVLWQKPVGEGHSSPVVANGLVFLHTKMKDKEEEELTVFEAETGKQLWSKSYARKEFKSMFGHGPRPTPIVSGDRVYSFGVSGILTCWEAKSGKQHWQVDTLKEFKADNLFFGVSCSPIIEGNRVLVNVGGQGASVVAFEKDTGKVAWKVLDDKASYSSPIAFGKEGERQVVFLTQEGVVSLSPEDGKELWKYPLKDRLNESSTTPVRMGEMLLASSVSFGSVGLRLESKDGKPSAVEVWKNPALTCYFSTPIPVGKDHVYMVTGSIFPPQAVLRCVDIKSGKELWNKPKIGKYHASLIRTGDDKLLMLDEAGNLALLDPNPKEYRELARSKICGETWAHAALAKGMLFVRDAKELICLKFQEPAP